MNVEYYKGVKSIYFKSVISNIIKIANLNKSNKTILDFGCGVKMINKMLPNGKILNYDIDPKYSEYDDYKELFFDIAIFNHVLMYMNEDDIALTFENIKKINKKCEFVIGIGKENIINKTAAILSLNFTAHKGTLTNYNNQVKILKNKTEILKIKKNVFFMTDIYYSKF